MELPAPHGAALRKGRVSLANQAYLVTFCTLLRLVRFDSWVAGQPVVAAMRSAQQKGLAETLCYVVMPDHVHWLLVLHRGSLSRLVQATKSQSAIAFNRRQSVSGSLWQKGFHDQAIRGDEELRSVAWYVVANPIRKGLVSDIRQYSLWDAVWLGERNREQARSYNPLDL